MTWLIVIGCVLLALLLLGQIRIGAVVVYSEAGLFLKIKAGPFHVGILPARAENEKKIKPAKPVRKRPSKMAAEPQKKPKRSIKDTLSVALRFLPLLAETAGQFKRKIRIDRLKLYVIWGASDPAAAAKGFGAGNAAMGILWPLLEHNFKVKEHDLRVDVDFERTTPEVIADAQATLTIGQSLTLVLRVGIKALKIYLGIRREQTEQKAVQA